MWPFCSANNPWWLLLPLILGFLTGLWAWRKSGFSVDTGSVGGALGSAVGGVTGAVGSAASGVTGAVTGAVSGAADLAGSAVSGVADVAGSAASGAVNLAGSAASGVAGAASTGIGAVAAAGAGAAAAVGAVATTAKAKVSDTASSAKAAVLTGGAAAAAAVGIAAAVGDPDDLLKIKGIGPKLNGVLNNLGITRFDQIAAWTANDVDKVDDHMPDFQGRIVRDEWIPQAKLLSTGQHAEWERIYGTVKVAAGVAGAVALTAIGIPAAVGAADDLLQIKGVGPKLNTLLISLGVTRFDQIAAWGADEIDKVDDHLGTFKNRITRDSWIEQAGLLARGAIAEFEAKFGKLDSENK